MADLLWDDVKCFFDTDLMMCSAGFLREIGRRLGKPVLMDPEGDCGHPVLGLDVEADRVVLLADSQVR
ncbi:hypothetical protein [Streptomyces sp. NPDC020996]|uniref:hypothetical protein n=1 Tax=Streptomyces sp. NPDC020996 TaxID=3154791 RepID=UPI0033CE092F